MTAWNGEKITPTTLPEHPIGWTTELSMHLNLGRGKGAATYSIVDEHGRRIEGIMYGYNSEGRGFTLIDTDADPDRGWLTWAQLREAYAKQIAESGGT